MCGSVWILEPWDLIDGVSIMGCMKHDIAEGPALKATADKNTGASAAEGFSSLSPSHLGTPAGSKADEASFMF